ncbi:hypothetical protein FALBO_15844 [Fusarium albosuccineum]|uniref:Uncharacterized protein n=1 Tax=Fusarium albosuccineum TaxID=1237068 RepID=A0A8H4KRM7_9HYPO|nr:hypothetical protein FALBO_15844 [Fusarium albosuccineum]
MSLVDVEQAEGSMCLSGVKGRHDHRGLDSGSLLKDGFDGRSQQLLWHDQADTEILEQPPVGVGEESSEPRVAIQIPECGESLDVDGQLDQVYGRHRLGGARVALDHDHVIGAALEIDEQPLDNLLYRTRLIVCQCLERKF